MLGAFFLTSVHRFGSNGHRRGRREREGSTPVHPNATLILSKAQGEFYMYISLRDRAARAAKGYELPNED